VKIYIADGFNVSLHFLFASMFPYISIVTLAD